MSDVDYCDCVAEYEILETELGEDSATDLVRCTECDHTWTWERSLTTKDEVRRLRRALRELGDGILEVVGLR